MSRPSLPRRGLYVITDCDNLSFNKLLQATEMVLAEGIQMLQLRSKKFEKTQLSSIGKELIKLCRKFDIPLIVNDDPELARRLGAAGVHLGKDDAVVVETRISYPNLLIGVSCYNDVRRAIIAERQGADYIAFGSFYYSVTKPSAATANRLLLERAKARIKLPIVAIGGITPENGHDLISAGADFLAVTNGLYSQADLRGQAKKYMALFK